MKLTIGELRSEFGDEHKKTLINIIDSHQHIEEDYYVLVYAKKNPLLEAVIDEKFIILTRKQANAVLEKQGKMLGTMMYKVDNKEGDIERLYILPLDRPLDMFELEGAFNKEIYNSLGGN